MAAYAFLICQGGHGPGIPACGPVELTLAQYMRQMDRPNRGWECPNCGGSAEFDDDKFEALHLTDLDDGDDHAPAF